MTRRGILLFAVMSLVWGIAYMLIRIAVQEITPAALVLGRTVVGAAILLPIAVLRVDLRPTLRRWPWLVAFATIEIAIPWLALASAEQRLSSSLAGLLIAGVPLVSAAIAVLTGSVHRLGSAGVAGLVLGLLGVGAIVGGDFRADDLTSLLQMVVVVVCYAIGPAILARHLAGLSQLAVMSLSVSLVAIAYVPMAAISGWPTSVPGFDVLAAVAILGVVCTAIAFIAFGALIEEVGPVRATVITYINPMVAAVVGVLILHETFTLAMSVGFGLVILGSALGTRAAPSRPAATAASPAP